ncbi:Pterin 4 alpha carbinolamine dehydratase protein [Dioscorea alata]|uniref:Pterin 4 alpha carbinolamine dehydratase protein n=1 Tax=Dioscorea alata TaxID=55571 RepID=A0ACB7U8B9_DIOAL|nr:Pterin 4 alpha carbinolamine dehydratase protein [Dioscorea alata]
MLLSLVQKPYFAPLPSFQSSHSNGRHHPLLKTLFIPSFINLASIKSPKLSRNLKVNTVCVASMLESPVLWLSRLIVFYVLIKTGIAGSPSNPFISSDLGGNGEDLGFAKWIEGLQGKSDDKEAINRRKLVSKWHPTTKGTLKRSYRVPSKAEGRRLLKSIAGLLSDDDHFVDATSHKGCQIRRESAHGESVCCNNVRALFDELPTPHLVVEITAFPAGPLTEKDYVKAEKLERVLRSGSSI